MAQRTRHDIHAERLRRLARPLWSNGWQRWGATLRRRARTDDVRTISVVSSWHDDISQPTVCQNSIVRGTYQLTTVVTHVFCARNRLLGAFETDLGWTVLTHGCHALIAVPKLNLPS